MHHSYSHLRNPQFRILSDSQIEELHLATLQILERTGVAFGCQEAIELLDGAGADVSNPKRVRIPSYLVEQALRTAPKTLTLYTREGEPAMVLNTMTSHFGGQDSLDEYLDPYTRQKRQCYVEDIAEMARVVDALPNLEWLFAMSACPTVPGVIADKVSLLHSILNTSKPVACQILEVPNLIEMIEICSIVAGSEEQLRKRPFFVSSSEPVSPLVQAKEAMEKSLICADRGIPNVIHSTPMAGATHPATFAGCLALTNAEVLSHLVVTQLKKLGAPVIIGSVPGIMDMKTTIFPYGAPELSLLTAALVELYHFYYRLPIYGFAGEVDADIIDAQAAAEATYQFLLSALSGADFIHGVGEMNEGRMASPEFAVFGNEIIGMVNVVMNGIEINDETLPLNLIERVGPGGTYISEKHTLEHFRKFWVPTIFDRSVIKGAGTKNCEALLKERTINIIETHQPKPLPEGVVKELKKVERGWFKRVGLEHGYPRREQTRGRSLPGKD